MCYARNSAKGHSTPAPVLAHLPFPGVKQQAHLPLDPQVLKTKGNSFHSVHLVPAPNLLRCQVFQVDIQPCQREDRTPPSTYVQQRQESGGFEHTGPGYSSWNVSVFVHMSAAGFVCPHRWFVWPTTKPRLYQWKTAIQCVFLTFEQGNRIIVTEKASAKGYFPYLEKIIWCSLLIEANNFRVSLRPFTCKDFSM